MTEGYYGILPSVLGEDESWAPGFGGGSQTVRLMDSGQFDNTDYIRSYLSVIILSIVLFNIQT